MWLARFRGQAIDGGSQFLSFSLFLLRGFKPREAAIAAQSLRWFVSFFLKLKSSSVGALYHLIRKLAVGSSTASLLKPLATSLPNLADPSLGSSAIYGMGKPSFKKTPTPRELQRAQLRLSPGQLAHALHYVRAPLKSPHIKSLVAPHGQPD